MKLRPPLRMAGAVLVLYAFLAVFFQRGERRSAPPEPIFAAESPGIVPDPEPGYRIFPPEPAHRAPDGTLAPGQFERVKIRDASAPGPQAIDARYTSPDR